MLAVGGAPMLARVLAAAAGAGAAPLVVVGPPRGGLPGGVLSTREEPAGGGPVAAAAAGLALVGTELVALLGADLPFLTAEAVALLMREVGAGGAGLVDEGGRGPLVAREVGAGGAGLVGEGGRGPLVARGVGVDGAVFVDEGGRRQLLCGVWRTAALVGALRGLPAVAGASMRSLVSGLAVREVRWPAEARLDGVDARAGAGVVRRPPYFDCDTEDDLRRAGYE